MRSTLRPWLMCGAIGVAGLAMPAAAQTLKEAPAMLNKQDAAAQHFQLGVEFYRAGDYAAARVEFEAAFGLSQLPDRRVDTRRRAGLRRSVSEGLSPNPTCPFR